MYRDYLSISVFIEDSLHLMYHFVAVSLVQTVLLRYSYTYIYVLKCRRLQS